jgi:glycosyltransferase involved in cell wall biosynthesis
MNNGRLPSISVALSVYNAEQFLASAIDSVLSQTFTDFECLILDDGSTDGSRAIIEAYAARDSRIRPIFRANKGLIVSLNQLLAEARAPIIARMDADDISLPERFARQYAFLQENPDYGVVGCWTDEMDEHGAPWPLCMNVHPLTHEAFLQAIDADEPLLCHPAVMYRRDVVLSVGGYHAAFKHCEDLDLWLRLASVTHIGNLPERLIRYRHYAGQVSSRHATQQGLGAAIAKLAYHARKEGRPDPTEHLDQLPPLDQLDAMFDGKGLEQAVRAKVAQGVLYSIPSLRGEGFELLLRHLADGGDHAGMWRTVLRLIRFGSPWRAVRLALALIAS